MRFLIVSTFFVQCIFGIEFTATVKTKFGDVRGFLSDRFPGQEKRAEIFLGLPYALPPIGSLRFEKTQPYNLTWLHEREAIHFGPGCISMIDTYGLPIDEDCLTLNIFRPHSTTPSNRSLPVLVYVHGGGFAFGLSTFYNYQNLSNNFVSRDLIVVTLNYRLGIYGFASTGDAELPGNLGLFDQAMAFKWIYDNIESFGGDRHSITGWGLSAGAASISLLTLSPHSQQYISQTIEMSGSGSAAWSVSDETIDYTFQFAAHIGCLTSDSKILKDCFLSKSQEFLLEMSTTFIKPSAKLLQFTPRIDGDFLPLPLDELIQKAPKIKTLSGCSQSESYYFTILNKDAPINSVAIPPSRFHDFNRQDLESYITQFVEFLSPLLNKKKTQIHQSIVDFYTREAEEFENNANSSLFFMKRFNELTSDFFFNIPALFLARARSAHGSKNYLYVNSYFNPDQYPSEIPLQAATHANSYPYMNGLFPVGEFAFNERDLKFQKNLVDILVRFVIEGRPADNWDLMTVDSLTYGLFDEKAEIRQIKNAPFKESYEFWLKMNEISGNRIFSILRQPNKKTEL